MCEHCCSPFQHLRQFQWFRMILWKEQTCSLTISLLLFTQNCCLLKDLSQARKAPKSSSSKASTYMLRLSSRFCPSLSRFKKIVVTCMGELFPWENKSSAPKIIQQKLNLGTPCKQLHRLQEGPTILHLFWPRLSSCLSQPDLSHTGYWCCCVIQCVLLCFFSRLSCCLLYQMTICALDFWSLLAREGPSIGEHRVCEPCQGWESICSGSPDLLHCTNCPFVSLYGGWIKTRWKME